MSQEINYNVDWCSYEAAKYACLKFHYSKAIPSGKLLKFGVWEEKKFIGVIIFYRGSNRNIGSPYGLTQYEVCELTRVALTKHSGFVSQYLMSSIKKLKAKCPGIKLIVSYADKDQNHYGKIYQATNWIYEGVTAIGARAFVIRGKKTQRRTVDSNMKRKGNPLKWIKENIDGNATEVITKGKHKYLMPLNKKIRKQILTLSKPYPR